MPRQQQPWFRMYVETFPDAKIRRLTPAQRWVFVAALGAAKESSKLDGITLGQLYVTAGVPMTTADLASYADVKERDVKTAVQQMTAMGMVAVEDGVIRVRNFPRRQFLSDDVTARTRDHRNRTEKERSNDVPTNVPGNDDGNVPTDGVGTSYSHAGGRAGRADRGSTSEKDVTSSLGSRNVPPGSLPQIVRAYVESGKACGVPTPADSQTKVERSARKLLLEGYPLPDVLEAAKNAAVAGYNDLATQLQRDAARAKPATAGPNGSTADQRAHQSVEAGRAVAAEQHAYGLDEPERRALA